MKLLSGLAAVLFMIGTASAGLFSDTYKVTSSSSILDPGQPMQVELSGKTLPNIVQNEMFLRYKLVMKYDDDSHLSAIPNVSIKPSMDGSRVVGTFAVPMFMRNTGKAKICFQDSRAINEQTSSNKAVIECSEYFRIAPRPDGPHLSGRPTEEQRYRKTKTGDFSMVPLNLRSNRIYRMTANLYLKSAFTADQLRIYLKGPKSADNVPLTNAAIKIDPSNFRMAQVVFVTPHLSPYVDEYSVCIKVAPDAPNNGKSDRACSTKLSVAEIGAGGAPVPNRFMSPVSDQQYPNAQPGRGKETENLIARMQVPGPGNVAEVRPLPNAQNTRRGEPQFIPATHRPQNLAVVQNEEWPDMNAVLEESLKDSTRSRVAFSPDTRGFPEQSDARFPPASGTPQRARRPVFINGQEFNDNQFP